MDRDDLKIFVSDAIRTHGGRATIVEVAQNIWELHQVDLEGAGDLFYTWQYDMRWAATQLRKIGKIKSTALSPKGVWELGR